MDRETETGINPAKLIIGNSHELIDFAKKVCKEVFCNQRKSECNCITCIQIEENRHHNVLWLKPENQYKLQDIDIIFEKASLALDENEKFFFVIENAELMNIACSNRLLKIIEEPPAGYRFIFLTERPQDILDTIKSRCVTTDLQSNSESPKDALTKYFTTEKIDAPDFLFFVDKLNITEQQTIVFLDEILKFWIETNRATNADKKIQIITHAFQNLPGTGGSKLFWKNFYTKFY